MTLAEELAESGILRKYLESVIADGRSIIFAKEHIEALLRSLEIDINAAILAERERCCKAVCEGCRDNAPLVFGYHQRPIFGVGQERIGTDTIECLASPIREKEDTTVDDQHPGG
jgi:hypothetical protein